MYVEQPTFDGGRHLLKRTLNLIVSALTLLVRQDSTGGVFYSLTRTGRRGLPFRMHRFRTMRAAAEQTMAALAAANEGAGPLFKIKDDPRVTCIGAFRRYIRLGLTGLWQMAGRSNLGWDESIRLDLYYVENWSVTGDLRILWRTFKVMTQPEGAY